MLSETDCGNYIGQSGLSYDLHKLESRPLDENSALMLVTCNWWLSKSVGWLKKFVGAPAPVYLVQREEHTLSWLTEGLLKGKTFNREKTHFSAVFQGSMSLHIPNDKSAHWLNIRASHKNLEGKWSKNSEGEFNIAQHSLAGVLERRLYLSHENREEQQDSTGYKQPWFGSRQSREGISLKRNHFPWPCKISSGDKCNP